MGGHYPELRGQTLLVSGFLDGSCDNRNCGSGIVIWLVRTYTDGLPSTRSVDRCWVVNSLDADLEEVWCAADG